MRYLPLALMMVWTASAMEEGFTEETIESLRETLRIHKMILNDKLATNEERAAAVRGIVRMKMNPRYKEIAQLAPTPVDSAPIPLQRARKFIDKKSFLRSSSSSVPATPKLERKKK